MRTYPWGNVYDGKLANTCDKTCPLEGKNTKYDDGQSGIAPVGSYPGGASPYGASDMAGNVWEWVMDWYDVYPEGDSSVSDEFGQFYRVIRGGAWSVDYGFLVRVTQRESYDPSKSYYHLGFRCAQDE
jgi:formylglycine-generating enzyme required for sulfatase activity